MINNELLTLETPRQRIKRLNKQIEYWRCYGYTRICQQDICSFCQHLLITKYYEGGADADCLLPDTKFTNGDDINHCRKFKAVKHWQYRVENLLSTALMDIIKDQCKTYTENQVG